MADLSNKVNSRELMSTYRMLYPLRRDTFFLGIADFREFQMVDGDHNSIK